MDTAVKFLVLTIAVVTVAFAVIREGLNYLNYPSLQIIRYPADRREIVIYHRGSSQRKATLFVRKLDPKASPVKIADLNYKDTIAPAAEEDPLMGKLSWTADGTAVVAMGRETRSEPDPPPLWIYDVGSYTLYSPGKFRSGQIMGQEHIDAILKVKRRRRSPDRAVVSTGGRRKIMSFPGKRTTGIGFASFLRHEQPK